MVRAFHVSTGAADTPTPPGSYAVWGKFPRWWSKPYQVWMPYSVAFFEGYAFHQYWSVPVEPVSHGCVRITDADAVWFYDFMSVGTPVTVVFDLREAQAVFRKKPPSMAIARISTSLTMRSADCLESADRFDEHQDGRRDARGPPPFASQARTRTPIAAHTRISTSVCAPLALGPRRAAAVSSWNAWRLGFARPSPSRRPPGQAPLSWRLNQTTAATRSLRTAGRE